ncbi:A disintegrin and metalloproteinase with thrombospondin motifs 7 [Diprion similis]|uniref:A disintegrin and metalloproteinase with thrombospondin motifs 7 n=1 Tax=Diprion similis TaxID=362088 RepID=UPI001EF7FE49|nr:A disintegrin and metalloproteinase with thrombospondin motifs 7 [Diprion similis]
MWILLILQAVLAQAAVRINEPAVRGIYTHGEAIDDFDVATPYKVTPSGELLSHNVTHHHDDDGAEVHYRMMVAGSEYHLDLQPSRGFISPGLTVERRKRDVHVRRPPRNHGSKCHYHGVIRGHENSHVAISACDGLTGVLRGDHGEFWMEPVAVGSGGWEASAHATTSTAASGRPHLVFRRSNPAPASSEVGAKAGQRRRKKRKKKHEKNCGTREPRRLTETRLEWQTQPGLVQVQGRGRRKYHPSKKWHRFKRSVSRARHVEALVVADTSMMAFHQDGDVETYLLTIMNMVSSLYLDPTIGNFINVVVVRIILMEEDDGEQGLNVTVNADKTLYNFCKWQQMLNPGDDSHPNHHDVAILVTREDICSRASTPCSTLGVAHVAGMCQPDRSCSVNEDNGITLAHTITHELGHNFGMYHDTEKIGCSRRDGNTLHVMTPSFEVDTVGVAWSRCSRRDITNFLDQGKGQCLEDEPADNDYAYPDLPPGAMYNAEHQCRLQFGVREAAVCSPLQEICSKLWCVVDGICTSMLHPAAPGTHCGKHMWCQNQECVPIVDMPSAIDGGWGEWGKWEPCSRTCGAGVSIIERKCDHPEPAHGGKFCVGERRRYKICNTEPCPEGAPSFRSVQCTAYNDKPYKGKNYTWLPYFDQSEPCELYCTDTEESVIVPWGESALDGTPCNVGTRDMCIAGICKKVGCDWVVESDATEDRCGVCHGDGTQCKTTTGQYDKNEGPGYNEVVVIPAGSRNINLEEIGNNRNYIGIGVPKSDKYFLNGKRQITLAGEYEVAGTPALYERDREREKVRIPGPIKEDIVVYLICRGHYRNFGLRYEYTVPKAEPDRAPEYSWVFSDWSLCTVTCGGGFQISKAFCHESKSGVVGEDFCKDTNKPEPVTKECNQKPCPARWWVGPWQMCTVTCGIGVRKRSVMCVSSGEGEESSDLALPDSDCNGEIRPEELDTCPALPMCETTSEIPLIVYASSKENAFYNVTSNENYGITVISSLTTEKPEILEFDNVVDGNTDSSMYDAKAKWTVSEWSLCQYGKRTREVSCPASGDCDPLAKPVSVEDCRIGKWVTGKWKSCNATCASRTGVKRRNVECRDRVTNLLAKDCNPVRRPLGIRRCNMRRQCDSSVHSCRDTLDSTTCDKYSHMCNVSAPLRESCCVTCSQGRRHVRHNRRHLSRK